MHYLLIALCVVTTTIQSVFKKHFGQKGIKGDFIYSGMVTLFALVFFLITAKDLVFQSEMLPYSFAFAAVYAGGTITSVLALRWGSLAITSLVMSYSLVIPTLYGLIFLNETVGSLQIIGLCILLVSLFLVKGERPPADKKTVSAKWLIAVAVSFVCNGCCSIIQKEQQNAFNGIYNSSFMIVALAIAAVVSFIAGLIAERKDLKAIFRHGIVTAALCGLSNGATNYLVMVIVATVAASLFFPLLSAGQLILTFLISVFLYKEKFLPRQLAGLALGIAALVLLNI